MNYKQKLYLGRWGVHPSVDFLAGNNPAQKMGKDTKNGVENGVKSTFDPC